MLIAKNTADGIVVADYRDMFPNTSFSVFGPSPDFLTDNGCLPVMMFRPYDITTQRLVQAAPYIEDGQVFTVSVVDLTTEEIAAVAEAKRKALIPLSVTPRQIRQALTRAGLRAAVEAAVAAGDQDTKDWWEFATEFERNHDMVVEMGTALGKTERELDDLFTLAGTL